MTQPYSHPQLLKEPLRRQLKKWQIFMIVLSSTIGVGLFMSSGEILAIAGPGATVLAFGIIGLLACMVTDGLSEMVLFWPVPNPMIEFVSRFVDHDLAGVIGFAYWLLYAMGFAVIIITGEQIVHYWSSEIVSKVLILVGFPIISFLMNYRGVKMFGYLELFSGTAKLLTVLLLFVSMLVINLGGGPKIPTNTKYVDDGFQYDEDVSTDSISAAFMAIPMATYSYLGVEAFTMTAFEAEDSRELELPARNISYSVFLIYILNILGYVLNVSWTDDFLPRHIMRSPQAPMALPVIAIRRSAIPGLASFVNACLVFCALSAANSALFVASRTLYGIGLRIHSPNPNVVLRSFAHLANSDEQGTPAWAVIASMVFAWVPLTSFISNESGFEVQHVFINIAATVYLLVWFLQSLAFIRYRRSISMHADMLQGSYRKYNRQNRSFNLSRLGLLQPILAYISLFLCLIIIVLFIGFSGGSIKTWIGPLIMATYFVSTKLKRIAKGGMFRNSTWQTPLGEWEDLRKTIDQLHDLALPPPIEPTELLEKQEGTLRGEIPSGRSTLSSQRTPTWTPTSASPRQQQGRWDRDPDTIYCVPSVGGV